MKIFEDIETIASMFGVLVAVLGGLFVFFRYFVQRDMYPRMNFSTDVVFRDFVNGHYIVELYCSLENRGLVRHKFTELEFNLHGLRDDDPIEDGDKAINQQLRFPTLLKSGSWFPQTRWQYSFVEPGTLQEYRHVASIPASFACVIIHGKVNYPGTEDFHSANRVVQVPDPKTLGTRGSTD